MGIVRETNQPALRIVMMASLNVDGVLKNSRCLFSITVKMISISHKIEIKPGIRYKHISNINFVRLALRVTSRLDSDYIHKNKNVVAQLSCNLKVIRTYLNKCFLFCKTVSKSVALDAYLCIVAVNYCLNLFYFIKSLL